MAKKKAAKKAIPDPIGASAQDLKDKLLNKRQDLVRRSRRERNPDKKQALDLQVHALDDVVEHLDHHILNRPFTLITAICP